jgi:hypothetical protein
MFALYADFAINALVCAMFCCLIFFLDAIVTLLLQ